MISSWNRDEERKIIPMSMNDGRYIIHIEIYSAKSQINQQAKYSNAY